MESLVSIKDFERVAAENLPKAAYDYYRSGANACFSLHDNEYKFREIHLKPSLFADRTKPVKLDTTILGHSVKTPICIASTAFHRMATNEGELATARAAQAYMNTSIKLSSWSTTPLEDVAAQAPDSLKFFQMYLSKIPEVNIDIYQRIKKAGYKAIHLTTDT